MRLTIPFTLLLALVVGCQTGTAGGSNRPPVAVAGADQSAFAGDTVTLDASASSDPDGDALTYTWSQSGGSDVQLTNADQAKATFVAPTVTTATTLVFKLVVNDGKVAAADTTSVTVNLKNPNNHNPTVTIVAPSSVLSGQSATLDASNAADVDGDQLTFTWTQTAGPAVTLSATNQAIVSFTAPTVAANTTVSFALTVSDPNGGAAHATADLTVLPPSSNRPPVANAGADQTVNTGATVTLHGSATDPDGDAIKGYQWTQTAGPTVTLSSATAAQPTFVAPTPAATTTLTFSLTATDAKDLSSAPATTHVTVNVQAVTATFTKVVSLHSVTRSSIVVFFLTDNPVAAVVDYGVNALTEHQYVEPSAGTRHVITLSGLSADTSYQYKVTAGTSSSTGSFTTAIDYAATPKSFSFAVAGDARGHAEWTTVSNAILAKNPRFLIQTGDNNDSNGSAANWNDYYSAGKALFAKIPVFAAQGNHDTGSNWSVYNIAPQSSSNADDYYAFVYGNAGFVAINTNSSTSTMNTWVSGALSKLTGGPLFAFHHHPLYSCGLHGSSTALQGTYQSGFETNKLTTDFTGHDHDLIFWSTINSVRYVVSGGGGTSLYLTAFCQGPYSNSTYGFMMVDVNGATINETFYDDKGAQLYTTGAFQAAGASVTFANLNGLVVY